jgi:hypothetical protein
LRRDGNGTFRRRLAGGTRVDFPYISGQYCSGMGKALRNILLKGFLHWLTAPPGSGYAQREPSEGYPDLQKNLFSKSLILNKKRIAQKAGKARKAAKTLALRPHGFDYSQSYPQEMWTGGNSP